MPRQLLYLPQQVLNMPQQLSLPAPKGVVEGAYMGLGCFTDQIESCLYVLSISTMHFLSYTKVK